MRWNSLDEVGITLLWEKKQINTYRQIDRETGKGIMWIIIF